MTRTRVTGKFYITTAIDYSNGEPHLGHAFEKIGADCVARYRRLRGHRVHFVIGMDEHGQKVAQAAEEAGVERQAWVDDVAAKFQATWRELTISHDDFIRTTERRHHRTVTELLRRIRDAGYLSQGTYQGYYCVGCEAYKLERELVNGQCPIHPTREIKWVEEANYFFALGAFRERLLKHYEEHPEFVQPATKLNEVRNVVRDWAADQRLSVSRSRVPWGIPWPDDPAHTVYVWFDALVNYLSATGFPDPEYDATWPAELHVIGPDIARFHAAIWPAMLLAAGLEIPKQVWCHGWVSTEAGRFSKSAGVEVTLRNIIDRHGPDALRYFLLREVPWHSDGTFTWQRFDARYTADLADGYGNLVSRVLAMIRRYANGTVPDAGADSTLERAGVEVLESYRSAMDGHLLHEGAATCWSLVDRANQFVEQRAPWQQAKAGRTAALAETLGALARALFRITALASPFMPTKTQAVWSALGLEGLVTGVTWPLLAAPHIAGRHVRHLTPLFPKPETDTISA